MFAEANLFGRSFIVGYFLPAVLFIGVQWLLLTFVTPHIPWFTDMGNLPLIKYISAQSTAGVLAVVIVTSVLFGFVLLLLRRFVLRFLEGYYLKGFFLYEWWYNRELEKFRSFSEKIATLRALENPTLEQKYELDDCICDLLSRFPGEEEIKPTRLGNIARAFEYYPKKMYGIDSIVLWPRLSGVISKEYTEDLDNLEAITQFFANNTLLLPLAGLELILTSFFAPEWFFFALGIALVALTWCSYSWACIAADQWGNGVKSCFDVFRLDLIKKFGYKMPESLKEEQDLWGDIGLAYIGAREPDIPYANASKKEEVEFTNDDLAAPCVQRVAYLVSGVIERKEVKLCQSVDGVGEQPSCHGYCQQRMGRLY